jgi:DNA primase
MAEYDDIFEEIKDKAELISEIEKTGITVSPSSRNTYKCLCPIHNEKTPSFYIYNIRKNQDFYCFGCGVGGTVIDFVKLKYKFSIAETLKYFKSNYSLDYDVSEKSLEKEIGKINKKRKNNNHMFNYAIMASQKINNFLNFVNKNDKENVEKYLEKIQEYLDKIDECLFSENIDSLKFYKESLEQYLEFQIKEVMEKCLVKG